MSTRPTVARVYRCGGCSRLVRERDIAEPLMELWKLAKGSGVVCRWCGPVYEVYLLAYAEDNPP